MKTLNAARAILKSHVSGGFTLLFNTDPFVVPASGYVVADGRKGLKIDSETDPALLILHVQKLGRLARKEGFDGIGGWIDGGILYLDPINYVPEAETAEKLGRERGEIAIWDLKSQNAVNLA